MSASESPTTPDTKPAGGRVIRQGPVMFWLSRLVLIGLLILLAMLGLLIWAASSIGPTD